MCDNWKKVFYDSNGTKENYKFPKILDKDNEYLAAVLRFFDTLIKDMKDNNIDNNFVIIAEQYKEIFNEVLNKYFAGNILDAYNLINGLIEEYKKSCIIFSKLSKSYSFNYYIKENKKWDRFLFYRARKGDISQENNEDALKHTPFDMRGKIESYRFSIPGQPCLYLGSTSYDCWIEMGKPDDKDFNVGCILLKKDYKILNLSTDTCVFLNAISVLKEESEKKLMFKSYLISQITSYCVKEENRAFKSEYILSQLITLACKSNNIDGISYISKRVSINKFGHNLCMNLAMFVPYKQGEKYSSIMEEMQIGTPINYDLFRKLKRESLNLSTEPLEYERPQTELCIGDFENKIPYRKTHFYDYDRYLRQITFQKYGIGNK